MKTHSGTVSNNLSRFTSEQAGFDTTGEIDLRTEGEDSQAGTCSAANPYSLEAHYGLHPGSLLYDTHLDYGMREPLGSIRKPPSGGGRSALSIAREVVPSAHGVAGAPATFEPKNIDIVVVADSEEEAEDSRP